MVGAELSEIPFTKDLLRSGEQSTSCLAAVGLHSQSRVSRLEQVSAGV